MRSIKQSSVKWGMPVDNLKLVGVERVGPTAKGSNFKEIMHLEI